VKVSGPLIDQVDFEQGGAGAVIGAGDLGRVSAGGKVDQHGGIVGAGVDGERAGCSGRDDDGGGVGIVVPIIIGGEFGGAREEFEARIGEQPGEAVVAERGADAADEKTAGAFAFDHEAGDEHPVAGADVGTGRSVDQLSRVVARAGIIHLQEDDSAATFIEDGGGVGAGREIAEPGGIVASGSEGEGAEGGGGGDEGAEVGGSAPVVVGGDDDRVATADETELGVGEHPAHVERREGWTDRAEEDGFVAGAADHHADDRSAGVVADVGARRKIYHAGRGRVGG